MNNKKILILLAGLEAMLLAVFIVLFANKTISLNAFIAVVIALSVVFASLILVIIKKFR